MRIERNSYIDKSAFVHVKGGWGAFGTYIFIGVDSSYMASLPFKRISSWAGPCTGISDFHRKSKMESHCGIWPQDVWHVEIYLLLDPCRRLFHSGWRRRNKKGKDDNACGRTLRFFDSGHLIWHPSFLYSGVCSVRKWSLWSPAFGIRLPFIF